MGDEQNAPATLIAKQVEAKKLNQFEAVKAWCVDSNSALPRNGSPADLRAIVVYCRCSYCHSDCAEAYFAPWPKRGAAWLA